MCLVVVNFSYNAFFLQETLFFQGFFIPSWPFCKGTLVDADDEFGERFCDSLQQYDLFLLFNFETVDDGLREMLKK